MLESGSRSILHSSQKLFTLSKLPVDVFILIFGYLTADALSKLSRTCRSIHTMVIELGWAAYWLNNQQPSFSLSCVKDQWGIVERVQYDVRANRAWANREFVARPLLNPWHGKLRPVLAISPSRLVIAAGSVLYSYTFAPSRNNLRAPEVRYEQSYDVRFSGEGQDRGYDITDITFSSDDVIDRTLFVGFVDGTVAQIVLPDTSKSSVGETKLMLLISQRLYIGDEVIQSIAISNKCLLSVSAAGTACVHDLISQKPHIFMQLRKKTWSTHLSLSTSTPYAAFGTSSTTPLALFSISESHISSSPFAISGGSSNFFQNGKANRSSAVYDISGASPSFPSSSDQVLVSGWYDGTVRIYDLRSRCHLSNDVNSDGTFPSVLAPVISLSDPWSLEPIYSVASGGGVGTHIAAGSARHSVVAFWDVRSPRGGWSVHAPGNDPSPVYSLLLESSRVFGTTQSRAFVYDFGPGVFSNTYPSLDRRHNLKKLDDNAGYYVTTYQHR